MKILKQKILFGGLVVNVLALGLILFCGASLLLNDLHEGTGDLTGLCQKCDLGGTSCAGPAEDECTGVEQLEEPGNCDSDCPDTPGYTCQNGGTIECDTTVTPCGEVKRDRCVLGHTGTYMCDPWDKEDVGCGLRNDCWFG